MSYVLIEGPMWKIWWSNDLGGGDWAFGGKDSTLGTFDGGGAIKRGHGKNLLIEEVKTTKNTNKDKIARHRKVRVIALISC